MNEPRVCDESENSSKPSAHGADVCVDGSDAIRVEGNLEEVLLCTALSKEGFERETPSVDGTIGEVEADSAQRESACLLPGGYQDPRVQVGGNCANDKEITGLHVCELTSRGMEYQAMEIEVKEESSYESHLNAPEAKNVRRDMEFSVSSPLNEKKTGDVIEVGSVENQKVETAEQAKDVDQLKNVDKQTMEQEHLSTEGSSVKDYQVRYCLPLKKEGEFSVHDLVWGKVRKHPWWPGQIFDRSESSKQALKYQKKNGFLIAYFGDKTFAWNEASQLRHFGSHFSQMEKQNNVEAFRRAVNCSLDEVSRQVKFGLACSCMPEEAHATIKSQIVENAGIRKGSNRRVSVDKLISAYSFEPGKLVEYIKLLALYPLGVCDRLELLVAQAQLLAFTWTKGYFQLPEFQVCGFVMENDSISGREKHFEDMPEHAIPVSINEEKVPYEKGKMKCQDNSSRKRKYVLENNVNPSKKERCLPKLIAGERVSSYSANDKATRRFVSGSSGKKRKAGESFSDNDRKKTRSALGADNTESPKVFQSYMVGERIRRVANQLTGSPPILKFSGERFQKSVVKVDRIGKKLARVGDGVSPHTPKEFLRKRMVSPMKYSSPEEMFSQLCLAARDPMKGYSFLTTIVGFFSEFRNSINLEKSSSGKLNKSPERISGSKSGSRSRKSSNLNTDSTETFKFDDMNDSYWTDRIIQSSPVEQSLQSSQKAKGRFPPKTPNKKDMPAGEPENSFHLTPPLGSKQQISIDIHELVAEGPVAISDEKHKEDFSPAALILNFSEPDFVPSELNLNKTFSRFGHLKESETEILRETCRARVVFKRCGDAEVALSSAGKYSIFGPSLVSYELEYLPSAPSKASPSVTEIATEKTSSKEGNMT